MTPAWLQPGGRALLLPQCRCLNTPRFKTHFPTCIFTSSGLCPHQFSCVLVKLLCREAVHWECGEAGAFCSCPMVQASVGSSQEGL
jgi:hypothetical protein